MKTASSSMKCITDSPFYSKITTQALSTISTLSEKMSHWTLGELLSSKKIYKIIQVTLLSTACIGAITSIGLLLTGMPGAALIIVAASTANVMGAFMAQQIFMQKSLEHTLSLLNKTSQSLAKTSESLNDTSLSLLDTSYELTTENVKFKDSNLIFENKLHQLQDITNKLQKLTCKTFEDTAQPSLFTSNSKIFPERTLQKDWNRQTSN